MRYAALKALILIVLGIIFSQYIKLPNLYLFVFLFLALILGTFTKYYSLYLAIFLASALNFSGYTTQQKGLKSFPLYDTLLPIRAKIIEEPMSERNRYTVKILTINDSPVSGKVFLFLSSPSPTSSPVKGEDSSMTLSYGDIIEFNSKINAFDFPKNPNLVDFNEFFYKQGYVGSIFTTGSEIKLIRIKQGNWFIQHLVNPLRHYFFKTIDEFFDGDEKDLLLGMILGETRGMSKTMRTTFADAGVAHILAVSGLNVAILIGVLLLLLPIIRIRGIWKLIIVVIVTVLYLCLVGFKASAFRAGLMAIFVSLGWFLERRYDIFNGVFIAAIIILLISPQALSDIGFQLSFSAVAAIILITPRIYTIPKEKKVPKFIRFNIILPSIASFAAGIGTAPIILYHFFRYPILVIFANLLIVPLVGLATPIGFLVILLNLFFKSLAGIFANGLWLMLKLIILISEKFANLSWQIIEPGRPSVLLIILFYLTIMLVLFWKNSVFRKLSLAVILCSLNFIVWNNAFQTKRLSVAYLDAKKGDAIFLNLPNERKMVIDAGEDGEVISSYLKSQGIHAIDLVCITHPHFDHYGGVRKLVNEFKIKNLLIATAKARDTMYTNLIARISKNGTNIFYADRGENVQGLGLIAEIYSPDASLRRIYNMNALDPNDLSIVLRITYNNTSFLLPGDLDDAEILKGLPVQSEILKSPHHGSKKANSPSLFSQVKPEYIVISGQEHIRQQVLNLIEQERIRPFDLRKNGALTIEVRGNVIKFKRFNGNKYF